MKKHVRSKFIFINLILVLSFSSSFGQDKSLSNLIKIRSEHGDVLKIIDSLSYKLENMSSEYFVDSLTNKPYSGNAIIYYGKYTKEYITILGGYKNGYTKLEGKNNDGEIDFNIHEYYSQDESFLFKKFRSYIGKQKEDVAMRINSTDNNTWIWIHYNKKSIQLTKKNVYKDGRKKKVKLKFDSLQELNEYFISIEKYSPERIAIMNKLQFFQSKNPTL